MTWLSDLEDGAIVLEVAGTAGQSFGAFADFLGAARQAP